MDPEAVIQKTAAFVKEQLSGESTGHDWWHIQRVWKNALHIGKQEKADLLVVQLAALLHDIGDWKFSRNEETDREKVKILLEQLRVEEKTISKVCGIIHEVSFKGAGVKTKPTSKEGRVVQDADRLDALGAIGIARCFATGAKRGEAIYDPKRKPALHQSFEEYKRAKTTSINHFYEKLLLLKDLMNTEAGKRMAEERHKFLEQFLQEFFQEWEGKDTAE